MSAKGIEVMKQQTDGSWKIVIDHAVDLANDFKEPNEPTGSVVRGLLNYPGSRIFFLGDINSILIQTQPFIDNLVECDEAGARCPDEQVPRASLRAMFLFNII